MACCRACAFEAVKSRLAGRSPAENPIICTWINLESHPPPPRPGFTGEGQGMITPQLVLMATTVAIAACVQGSIGIGFALIVAPVLAFLRPELLPVSLLFLMLPLNLFTLLREHQAFDWKGGSWITLGRAFGTLAGAGVLAALSSHALNLLIGAATVVIAVVTMVAPAFSPNRSGFLMVGLLTGISETATGIGGPPLALAYQHHRPDVLRSTVAGCFLLGELLSVGVLAAIGRSTTQQALSAALLLPFLAIGGLVSSFVRHSVNGRILRALVLIFAITSGAVLIVQVKQDGKAGWNFQPLPAAIASTVRLPKSS